jgi:hypothetical protein
MKLLTKAIVKSLPALYTQDNNPDPTVYVKFFNPCGSGTWYATEFDGNDTFFGYVTGMGDDELGYFSLSELSNTKLRFGMGIERDLYFKACKLSEVR